MRKRNRGGMRFVIAALLLLSAATVGIWLAVRQQSSNSASTDAGMSETGSGSVLAEVPTQGVADANQKQIEPGLDAGTVADSGTHATTHADRSPKHRGLNPEQQRRLAELLAHSRAARGKKLLTQQSNAQAALRIDPKHREARFLYGEALVLSGYPDLGCAQLKRVRRHGPALKAAKSAKCEWASGD